MNFFSSNFGATPLSINSSLTNQETEPRNRQKEVHVVCLLVFALSSHAESLLPLFTCVSWPSSPWALGSDGGGKEALALGAYDATTSSSTYMFWRRAFRPMSKYTRLQNKQQKK